MTDRVYPSAKPTVNGAAPAANGGSNPTLSATKAQLYNNPRPMYRPQPPPRRRYRRGFCCSCCLCTTLLIIIILLLAAIAGAVFWVLYRPHRPSFSISSLQLSKFNFTDTSLASTFNLTLIARNLNKKIVFSYEPIAVKIFSGDISVGDGSLPGFTQATKNITTVKAVISSSSPFPDGTDISALKSNLKNKNLPLKLTLDTRVEFKIGKLKTKKFRVRVNCDGIKISLPTGKSPTTATTANVKCKVDPRFKIIKWTV
ncbi:Late embryogenesis abundant (LEA) hydroxyproline-rich glycoprotein family [Forsythia ovata]|uniref:Late embryogenesis abundant (LEA) hydroxyproline-rich glycoprotein family n=1 Tax=Forsythia ovata TaxID=205694 RepID=A0ABD1TUE8_9LAMI